MSGLLSHAAAFLAGIAVGALLLSRVGRRGARGRDPRRALQQLYRESPRFFDLLKQDLGTPEFCHVREFAILESDRVTFVSEEHRFVYYEENLPELTSLAAALEENGFIEDASRGKTRIFRLRENFIDALESL